MHEITPAGGGDHFPPKKMSENREKHPQVVYSSAQPVAVARGSALVPGCDEQQALACVERRHVGGLQEHEDY